MAAQKHARLSASSAARWLKCTAAPRYEQLFPETTSAYAEEGRLAHAVCELNVLRNFTNTLSPSAFTRRINKLKKDSNYSPEMEKTAEVYIDHLKDLFMGYQFSPNVAAEVMVDFKEYVPEGFGTCDCIMIGGDTLNIVDYKHGKGIAVSAKDNPQMRLYALGALARYRPIYGDTITRVSMTIVQPRLQSEESSETVTVDELLEWGEAIKPIALAAYTGPGDFCPGEHCRFCRGSAQCKARAAVNMALEEFKDCVPEHGERPPMFGQGTLTDEEVGELLERGRQLVAWYKDLEAYAQKALMKGRQVPGWKLVEGRSNRTFIDQDAALAAAIAAGYDEALVYERRPKTLSALEKLMGKTEFKETLGAFVTKPKGAPTLAPMTDVRPVYNSAAADFAEVVQQCE